MHLCYFQQTGKFESAEHITHTKKISTVELSSSLRFEQETNVTKLQQTVKKQ